MPVVDDSVIGTIQEKLNSLRSEQGTFDTVVTKGTQTFTDAFGTTVTKTFTQTEKDTCTTNRDTALTDLKTYVASVTAV